jgi:hypothetical protein
MDGGNMARFKILFRGATPLALAITMGGLGVLPAVSPVQARSHVAPAIDSICQHTMRTQSWTSDYGACTESLTATMAAMSQSAVTQQARRTCEAQGVRGEGAAMAMCIVNTRQGAAAAPLSIDASIIPTGAQSYTRMNAKEQHQAEQQSCAALGLQPEGAAFQSCVHSLDAALFDADNPQS